MAFDPPIPGQTPLDDLSGLINREIRTQAALNDAEAENTRKCALKYLAAAPTSRSAPFDLAWARRLHREMFGDVWRWAGDFRTTHTNVGVRPHEIETALQALLGDLASWSAFSWPLLEQAVRLHHRAVQIHPFVNGNGRWSRMLANIWLKRHRAGLILWPDAPMGAESPVRDEYIRALRTADDGDPGPLLALHQRFHNPHA